MKEEFQSLRPEDIPPRRKSPNDPDEEDLLTKELFASLDSSKEDFFQGPTKEEKAILSQEDDELTKVIFADVHSVSKSSEPKVVDLASFKAEELDKETPIRQTVLDQLESVSREDLDTLKQYIQKPITVSRPRVKPLPYRRPQRQHVQSDSPVKLARPPAPAKELKKGIPKTPLKQARPQVKYANLPPGRLKIPIKKAFLAVLLVGLIGLASTVSGSSRLVAPVKLSLAGLSEIKGEGFLSNVSFSLPNEYKPNPAEDFLKTIIKNGSKYLVVGMSSARNTPLGGEPKTWAVVEINSENISVVKSGTVAELNAAIVSKTIPPEPIQAYKTNFDFFETGWFFRAEDFSKTFADFFRETTGDQVDGVLSATDSAVADLSSSLGISLSLDDPEWVSGLISTLANSSSAQLDLSGSVFEKNLLSRGFQFSLVDGSIIRPQKKAPTRDFIQTGLRNWEGGTAEIGLIDYSQEFFVDGSIVSSLSTTIENSGVEPSVSYVKTAVPKGSILISESGFSESLPVPSFNYEAEGFLKKDEIAQVTATPSGFFPNLDFFNEEEFVTIGGWTTLEAGQTKIVSLQWRLPFRLAWQGGEDTYSLSVFKPLGQETVPFRYRAGFNDGVSFSWIDPLGFVSLGTAEYQSVISSDKTLKAKIEFSEADD